jgi:hypothetical protein
MFITAFYILTWVTCLRNRSHQDPMAADPSPHTSTALHYTPLYTPLTLHFRTSQWQLLGWILHRKPLSGQPRIHPPPPIPPWGWNLHRKPLSGQPRFHPPSPIPHPLLLPPPPTSSSPYQSLFFFYTITMYRRYQTSLAVLFKNILQ